MIVSDSSPLIFLARLGRLGILEDYEITIPEEVRREIAEGEREEYISIKKYVREGVVKVDRVEMLENLPNSLHEGEKAAISLALRKKAKIVLLDERKARVIARLYGLTPRGTIGILREEYLQGRMDKEELKKLVFRLIKKGYRIKEEIISEFLESL
jgi:hypothetical protein